MGAELRLTAGPLQKYDHIAGDNQSDVAPVIFLNKSQR
jgi:hypothetical protein